MISALNKKECHDIVSVSNTGSLFLTLEKEEFISTRGALTFYLPTDVEAC